MATTTSGIEGSTGGRSGSYTRDTVFQSTHAMYRPVCNNGSSKGPIIRINPHEIHINDPNFIDEIYTNTLRKRDKYKWTTRAGYPSTESFRLIQR